MKDPHFDEKYLSQSAFRYLSLLRHVKDPHFDEKTKKRRSWTVSRSWNSSYYSFGLLCTDLSILAKLIQYKVNAALSQNSKLVHSTKVTYPFNYACPSLDPTQTSSVSVPNTFHLKAAFMRALYRWGHRTLARGQANVVVERPISIPEPYWANNSIIDNADNIFEPSASRFQGVMTL